MQLLLMESRGQVMRVRVLRMKSLRTVVQLEGMEMIRVEAEVRPVEVLPLHHAETRHLLSVVDHVQLGKVVIKLVSHANVRRLVTTRPKMSPQMPPTTRQVLEQIIETQYSQIWKTDLRETANKALR